MLKLPSFMTVIRFVATEWGCYSLVVFLSVLAKAVIPVMIGELPGPIDLHWIPGYALNFGGMLALVCLPGDVTLRWAMISFGPRARQIVPITISVTTFEIWDKTSRSWDGGTDRIILSICAVAVAGLLAGSLRSWIRRPRRNELDLDLVFR